MKNYKILLLSEKNNGKVKVVYEERNGIHYKRIKGEIPLELKRISEKNESFVRGFGLNKLELKITIN